MYICSRRYGCLEKQHYAFQMKNRTADEAYALMSQGLDLEEKGRCSEAIGMYERGISQLQTALEHTDQIKSPILYDKNLSNLKRFTDHLSDLKRRNQATRSTERLKYHHSRRDADSVALAHKILDEVLVTKLNITWDQVIGLHLAKQALQEVVILPMLRPDLFTGIRAPSRGILLFGPPGTGKTMLAKAVASESKAKFFSLSASSLTSKHYGEGEKLVRTLFEMARELAPSIVFIDEIDSILKERSENEHEASRRLKTEFFLQFDGMNSLSDDRILVLATSNRPHELDEAALRRFPKRIYIPLPDEMNRLALIKNLLNDSRYSISKHEFNQMSKAMEGFSASDITALVKEAAMQPIRNLERSKILEIQKEKIRPICFNDFKASLSIIRPCVSQKCIEDLLDWNEKFEQQAKIQIYLLVRD
jgi:SpoVK/Ycf46/Vps4 family AAA+-type ATPase